MKRLISIAAVPLSTSLKYRRNWNKNNPGVQIIQSFTKGKGNKASNKYRLYLPIYEKQNISIPKDIASAVAQAGYMISDYVSGIATQKDGKRQIKIGKLLKDEYLRNKFANDPQRQSHKNEYTCVISCHPYDIIGMSTGREWDQFSCMRLGAGAKLNPDSNRGDDGAYADTLHKDVASGTLVAYAIKNSDTNIKKPDARLLIKPYMNEVRNEILFRCETKIYGNPVPGFRETINNWLRKVNKNVSAGRYSLVKGLYNDGAGYGVRHMGPIAFADLSNPENLRQWVSKASISDFSQFFKEQDNDTILELLKFDELYQEYMFSDLIKDILHAEAKLDEALARIKIMIAKCIGRGSNELLSYIMNNFFARWTVYALSEDILNKLKSICTVDPTKNYSYGFRLWASKLNPDFALNNDGTVDDLIEKGLHKDDEYPFISPISLSAPKGSKLRNIALIESFIQVGNAAFYNKKTDWTPVSPDMFDLNSDLKYAIEHRIKSAQWNDNIKLLAVSANSKYWFTNEAAHYISLPYLEALTIDSVLDTPYIEEIFDVGVSSSDQDIEIVGNFIERLVQAIRNDTYSVKAFEQKLYEVAELVAEADRNTARYLVREIERALYN